MSKLEGVRPGGRSSLAKTLESLADLIPARSMVVIASDFYDEIETLGPALRRLRYDHHDLIGLHVSLDPQEIDFDLDDSGIFVDAEIGSRLKLDAPAVRKNYLKRFGAFCEELDQLFSQSGRRNGKAAHWTHSHQGAVAFHLRTTETTPVNWLLSRFPRGWVSDRVTGRAFTFCGAVPKRSSVSRRCDF